jgi:hypothetical protein
VPTPQSRPRLARVIRYSVAEASPNLEQPPSLIDERVISEHTLLQFAEATSQAEACAGIIDMELLQPRTFDWECVDQIGQRDRLEAFLSLRWRAALAAPAQQYLELTIEFISTLEHTLGDFSAPTAVSFSLGRRVYDMTIPQFAVATS